MIVIIYYDGARVRGMATYQGDPPYLYGELLPPEGAEVKARWPVTVVLEGQEEWEFVGWLSAKRAFAEVGIVPQEPPQKE